MNIFKLILWSLCICLAPLNLLAGAGCPAMFPAETILIDNGQVEKILLDGANGQIPGSPLDLNVFSLKDLRTFSFGPPFPVETAAAIASSTARLDFLNPDGEGLEVIQTDSWPAQEPSFKGSDSPWYQLRGVKVTSTDRGRRLFVLTDTEVVEFHPREFVTTLLAFHHGMRVKIKKGVHGLAWVDSLSDPHFDTTSAEAVTEIVAGRIVGLNRVGGQVKVTVASATGLQTAAFTDNVPLSRIQWSRYFDFLAIAMARNISVGLRTAETATLESRAHDLVDLIFLPRLIIDNTPSETGHIVKMSGIQLIQARFQPNHRDAAVHFERPHRAHVFMPLSSVLSLRVSPEHLGLILLTTKPFPEMRPFHKWK